MGFSHVSGDPIGAVVFADNVSFDGTERGGTITTDGQMLIGSTALPHIRVGTLTAGTGIAITNGPGTISIALAGSGVALQHLTGNTGGPLNPDGANNINTLGTGSITVAGVGSTLTTQLTGLTNHNLLIGAGTATITKLAPSATTGAPLISAGAAADPAFSTTFSVVDSTVTATLTSNFAGVVTLNVQNTNAANSAIISSVANSPGSGFYSSGVADDVKFWNFGIVPSNAGTNADGFNISYNAVGQSDPSQGTPMVLVGTGGPVYLPNAGSTLYVGTTAPTVARDFNIEKSNNGGAVSQETRNTSNTASSTAASVVAVAGSTASDCWNAWIVQGVQGWAGGIRNSDSQAWYLTNQSTLAAGTVIKATTAGEVTMPSQPAFSAYNSTARTNETGDGTTYTLIFNTEEYDQNNDFDGTSTFTAPVTGRYQFNCKCALTGLGALHNEGYIFLINTSSGSIYYGDTANVGLARTSSNIYGLSISKVVSMTAGQTLQARVLVGGSTKTVGVDNTAIDTYLDGTLLC